MWAAGLTFGQEAINPGLAVSNIAGIAASLTAVVSLISYVWISQRQIYHLSLVSYLLMAATALIVVATTGNTASPFIALWMLVVVFSGLFGWRGIIPIATVSFGYLAYLAVLGAVSRNQIVVFALAFLVPIIVSYTIWHRKSSHDTDKDKAYSELAQELSQVANKSEVVINAIADGVVAVDGRGIIQLINPAAQQIIGWQQSDAIGLDYRSVIKLTDNHDQALDETTDPVQQSLKTGQTVATDKLVLVTNAGKKLLISLHISSVGGTGAGAIIVFRDITDEVAEERQEAEFISTASHEMRTPVAAIEGYLGLALNPNTATVDPRAQAYLAKAHESAQHLGRLFQDLLDVSKVDDGRLSNNLGVVDIVASARDITAALMPSAQQKGLLLLFKPDIPEQTAQRLTPVYYAMLDNDHFRETLSNLIENAVKYTKAGDITVDVEGDEEHVVISVSDTGIGIPREDMPHLFQKFYRVDNSETREIGGTGLGLYLSRRLVETMNGRIWAESEYGKGSIFHMEFTRLSHEEAMSRLDAQSAAAEATAQNTADQTVVAQPTAAPLVTPVAPAVAAQQAIATQPTPPLPIDPAAVTAQVVTPPAPAPSVPAAAEQPPATPQPPTFPV